MSELGETFKAWNESKKVKKSENHASSIQVLKSQGIDFEQLSLDHYRVGAFDFWSSTGLFIERITGKRGRGVFNLMRKIK